MLGHCICPCSDSPFKCSKVAALISTERTAGFQRTQSSGIGVPPSPPACLHGTYVQPDLQGASCTDTGRPTHVPTVQHLVHNNMKSSKHVHIDVNRAKALIGSDQNLWQRSTSLGCV
eukprot:scaffold191680_cov22-Tisochrysis_lutea.AAC.1